MRAVPYTGPPVVYFARCADSIKFGFTNNLPARSVNIGRTARAMFGTDEISYSVILNGTLDLEDEIRERLAHLARFSSRPACEHKYDHCGYTEWVVLTDEALTCIAEYNPVPLEGSLFYALQAICEGR